MEEHPPSYAGPKAPYPDAPPTGTTGQYPSLAETGATGQYPAPPPIGASGQYQTHAGAQGAYPPPPPLQPMLGACPHCGGFVTTEYEVGCLIIVILLSIVCFPFGLLGLLCLEKSTRCMRCGATGRYQQQHVATVA